MTSLQAGINDFWSKFSTKKPSKVTSIFPRLLYASILPEHPDPRGIASAVNAAASYEAAAKECREKVQKIVRECHRINEKFTDSDFDIELDLDGWRNCLDGLEYEEPEPPPAPAPPAPAEEGRDSSPSRRGEAPGAVKWDGVGRRDVGPYTPGSVHRLDWVFKDPRFIIDGFSSSDINQGSNGDCWWLAAVATIAHRRDLMEKTCVAQDEECGVYGFVFFRDGEWISTVVDDNVYLKKLDFREAIQFNIEISDGLYDPTGEKGRKYKETRQTGSEALYFAHCADPNETWLPLLEKAYAKVHGEYDAIANGWSGEAVEDMTGGVTSTISTGRVLSKDRLWKELASKNRDFVFALSALPRPRYQDYTSQVSGVALGHAYSILDATEEVGEDGGRFRLVKIRNPWGRRLPTGLGEWNGPWSDGSKEWTPYWMQKLNHTFADDGIFWMLYGDVLETFKFLHRTRLFDEKWTVIQQWTSCEVAWLTGYSRTKFVIDVKKAGTIVIVLAQLDDRYFNGLEGQYEYNLHFLLKKEADPSTDYICRVRPAHPHESRSVNCEVYLEPGRYEVLPKITATRNTSKPTFQKVIKQFAEKKPQKLRQVGMQYDLAHAKGGVPDEDQKILEQKQKEKAKKKEKKSSVKVKIEIDIPESSKVEVTEKPGKGKEKVEDKEQTKSSQDGEGEKFEDAAESLEDGDTQKTKGKSLDGVEKAQDHADGSSSGIASKVGGHDAKAVSGDGDGEGATRPDKGAEKGKEPAEDDKKAKDGKDEETKADKPTEDDEKEGADSDETSDVEDDDNESRWNAVCVTCLRVYSQDPDLIITLVQPESTEQASSSLVQGQEPAGATQ